MNYYEVTFTCNPNNEISKDILASMLGEIGFESFNENENGILRGYVPENLFSEKEISEVITNFPLEVQISYTYELIISKNWNEEWEKHFFQPIIIDDRCAIHSTFHKDIPPVTYDIIIDPKMSFGTGHHETTSMMIAFLLDMDVKQKSFLDMGCGTAVLAILAAMKGANPVVAIDNDEWAYNNSVENIQLNHVNDIQVFLGDAGLLGSDSYDIILANINRNILLNDIHRYASCMKPGSELYMSGFYTEDMDVIKEECVKNDLEFITHQSKNNWAAVKFIKQS